MNCVSFLARLFLFSAVLLFFLDVYIYVLINPVAASAAHDSVGAGSLKLAFHASSAHIFN